MAEVPRHAGLTLSVALNPYESLSNLQDEPNLMRVDMLGLDKLGAPRLTRAHRIAHASQDSPNLWGSMGVNVKSTFFASMVALSAAHHIQRNPEYMYCICQATKNVICNCLCLVVHADFKGITLDASPK